MSKSRSTGLTLIELMIAMTLGLVIVAAVGALYLGSSRSFRQDERVSAMSDELRFALGRITRDIEMAGFWGSMIDPRSLPTDPAFADFADGVTDCGTAANPVFLAPGIPIQVRNDASAADINALFPCIRVDEVQPGTAAISIARVSGVRLAHDALADGRPYLQTAGANGALFIKVKDEEPPNLLGVPPDEAEYWRFQPTVYYIRRYSAQEGDGVPSLCRKQLRPLSPVAECFATGVQDLHFEFGIDSNADGITNFFTEAPTADQLNALSMVRIHALGRSQRPDGSYSNVKSFMLGNKLVAAPDDHFYRRVASLSVALRNPAAQRLLQ